MQACRVKVSKLGPKSHDTPDEIRSPAKTRVEIVRLPGHSLARMNMQPGWRWSDVLNRWSRPTAARYRMSTMSFPALSRCGCPMGHKRPSRRVHPTPFHRAMTLWSKATSRSSASRCSALSSMASRYGLPEDALAEGSFKLIRRCAVTLMCGPREQLRLLGRL